MNIHPLFIQDVSQIIKKNCINRNYSNEANYYNFGSKIVQDTIRRFALSSLSWKDETIHTVDYKGLLHKPGENYKDKNYIVIEHTEELLREHVKQTGGQVRTRFPPEPNGLLHIGHAKSISINFGYAEANDGLCFLRFDDTNPEMEDQRFIEGIQEMIHWLGFKPFEVTYASDYFENLYKWAMKLIEEDLAYVCHQPAGAEPSVPSSWCDRPVEESLHEFKMMRDGWYREGEATLRLKMVTQQRTVHPVVYRIKSAPHHRTKKDWCIYPTYDYAHGLCDSIQNITHSFCTSEFALRRSTYYWICNSLQVYCPVQIEFGRLNLLHAVVSKRKMKTMIEAGIVDDWDDPRLYTLVALQRRGFPAVAINAFCKSFGLRKDNTYIHPVHLHTFVREELDDTAPRIMGVLHPLKILIENFPYDQAKQIEVADIPKKPTAGCHTVTFDREIWIDQSDFKEEGEKGFRRLMKEQGVGLKYAGHVILLKEIVRDSSGAVDYLKVDCVPVKQAKKPKAFIHWVAKPILVEVRLYQNVFKSEKPENPESNDGNFLSDVNPESLEVVKDSLVGECSLSPFKPYQRFQFERVGYFTVDPDSVQGKLVFNRILELKQDSGF